MAKPYRIYGFTHRTGEIKAKRCRYWTTRPLFQSVVFPRFDGGVFKLLRSDTGIVAEVELQVSERVLGFIEQRGKTKTDHLYAAGSEYYQKPMTRFFETTGVCWYFPERTTMSEDVACRLVDAFCAVCGIQSRDLGLGLFRAKANNHLAAATTGMCIYDATNGSLRLTHLLATRFVEIVDRAVTMATDRQDSAMIIAALRGLRRSALALSDVPPAALAPAPSAGSEWVTVVAAGQRAIYNSPDGAMEVTVSGHRYTPHGLMYDLVPPQPGVRWSVSVADVVAIHGETGVTRFNVMTGEVAQADAA
jgi:hypothetical protein